MNSIRERYADSQYRSALRRQQEYERAQEMAVTRFLVVLGLMAVIAALVLVRLATS